MVAMAAAVVAMAAAVVAMAAVVVAMAAAYPARAAVASSNGPVSTVSFLAIAAVGTTPTRPSAEAGRGSFGERFTGRIIATPRGRRTRLLTIARWR